MTWKQKLLDEFKECKKKQLIEFQKKELKRKELFKKNTPQASQFVKDCYKFFEELNLVLCEILPEKKKKGEIYYETGSSQDENFKKIPLIYINEVQQCLILGSTMYKLEHYIYEDKYTYSIGSRSESVFEEGTHKIKSLYGGSYDPQNKEEEKIEISDHFHPSQFRNNLTEFEIKNFEEGKLKIIEAIRSTLKDEFEYYFFEELYPNLK